MEDRKSNFVQSPIHKGEQKVVLANDQAGIHIA